MLERYIGQFLKKDFNPEFDAEYVFEKDWEKACDRCDALIQDQIEDLANTPGHDDYFYAYELYLTVLIFDAIRGNDIGGHNRLVNKHSKQFFAAVSKISADSFHEMMAAIGLNAKRDYLFGLALRMFYVEVCLKGDLDFMRDEGFWNVVSNHLKDKSLHDELEAFLRTFLGESKSNAA